MSRGASMGVGLLATLWLGACLGEQSLPSNPELVAAKRSSTSDPTVDAVDPDNAPQDTTLDVRVLGNHYDPGSKVAFLLDGKPTRNITTNATRFVSSAELVANITIALNADTVLYDVQVTTSDGRKGIGIELFKVRSRWANRPNYGAAITLTFRDDVGDNIRSDGRGAYVDRECGVSATFNLTDARLDPDANRIHPQEATVCGGRDPRKVMVSFTDRLEGSPPGPQDGNTVGGNFFLVGEVELVTKTDGTVPRGAVIHGAGCAHGLRFSPGKDPQSDYVTVTKNPDGTWTVATQPFPNDVAVCIPDEHDANPPPRSYYHMPFRTTVRLK